MGACFIAAALALSLAAPAMADLPASIEIYGGMDSGGDDEDRPQIIARPAEKIVFHSVYAPGTVIVRTGERRLYYVLSGAEAMAYQVGVGREGFAWSGTSVISRKAEWPDWRPPAEMIEREAENGRYLPEYVPGGMDNPLGARALYIGETQFRIHGTNDPASIGRAMSSGCIRLLNEDVVDLFNRVVVGAAVIVE